MAKVKDHKEGNAQQRRHGSDGHGFESRCWQIILSREISFEVSLYYHLAVEFVHLTFDKCLLY